MDAAVLNREKELARQTVDRFVRRFEESYRLLVYHAALPLVLTPELLNYLRNHFLRGQVPWVAEVDLLLSDLCTPVGYELYAMDTAVRAYLLEEMQRAPELGVQRMQEVARLLLSYVRQLSKTNPFIGKHELDAQQWAAMVYLDDQRENAVRQIAEAYQESVVTGRGSFRAELARLSRLTQELAPQLKSHPELKEFAELITRLLANPTDVDTKALNRPYQVLPDVELRVPKELVPGGLGSEGSFPPLQAFPFEVVTVDAQGQEIDRHQQQARYFTEDLGNKVTLEMVEIPGGTFIMGSPATELERYDDEGPQHSVTVKSFFMGKYPITQVQWQAVATLPQVNQSLDSDPSHFKGANRPVEKVSWNNAVEFCARLSQKTGRNYRLPSEAEWEYACRAGTTTPFHFGETITTDLANYDGTDTEIDKKTGEPKYKGSYGSGSKGVYRQETTPVGRFKVANSFGLYDMHGNVWEWCADPWHSGYEGAPIDGSVWQVDNDNDNKRRLLRCGSWGYDPRRCRSAVRDDLVAGGRPYGIGFRVVCSAEWT